MADDDRDDADGASPDERIVREAKKRLKRCRDWERDARKNGLDDTKFAEGDSRNGYQWDDAQKTAREKAGRPALTVNKVRQGVLQILNDQRQNKSQIRVRPVGDGASFPAAEVFEGVIRHIEYASNAMETYDSAAVHQIQAGYGVWRITTEYAGDDGMDQEIYIRRVKDPNTVWLDPDCEEFDRSDARFGFVTRDMPRDVFKSDFPAWADKIPDGSDKLLGDEDAGWHDKDSVRVAEYFRRVETADTLHHFASGADLFRPGPADGIVRQSDVPKEHHDILAELATRSRGVKSTTVEWFKIAGDQVIERTTFPGRYIPLVVVIGEETVIDGKLDRKGHVRAMLDPQRMLNYYASQAVEFVAGQTKTPWIGAAAAFEGHEQVWANPDATTAFLPFNDFDAETGQKIEAPQRVQPPVSHPAAAEGMDRAERQMMAASGQYQAQFGEAENAKSGVAINARQRQGDNATYHFIDHMAQAQRHTGRILLSIIPLVYDTPRVIKIMAEDGDQSEVHVQPGAGTPHQHVGPVGPGGGQATLSPDQLQAMQADQALADKVKTIFDPTVGRYDVEADVGPSYGTKRQEAFNALQQIMAQNQELMKVAGDLLFKSADFPMADEIMERIKRSIDPAILGAAPPPAVQALQKQVAEMEKHFQGLLQQLHDKGDATRRADAEERRKDYEAETARMVAVGKIDPQALIPVVRQLVSEALGTPIVPLMAAHAAAEQALMPQPPAPAVTSSVPGPAASPPRSPSSSAAPGPAPSAPPAGGAPS